ncbi:MAG: sel1 repeat family protein [Hyphomicrobiaceae bacterium]|nr:sel1 repeat family protein [Hyphomicrobiaceae bacterium]
MAFVSVVLAATVVASSSHAQSAADAVNALAAGGQDAFLGAEGGISSADMLSVLEEAASAGDPLAMWRLGVMYESGTGVEQDRVKAFGYFSQIADQNADAAPKSIEADIVAQSFVKMGDYYRVGLPGAGIPADAEESRALLFHAASYFGDPEAQYKLGLAYLDENNPGSALQGARWLSLAAHKGHVGAMAVLGDLLFNGDRIEKQPVEGLMWLNLAHQRTRGSDDETWVAELLNRDSSIATPDQRRKALDAANAVGGQIASN